MRCAKGHGVVVGWGGQAQQTRSRANTNPYDTKAIAVGRSGCACGAQKVRVCWGGVGRRRCRVALMCVLSLKPFWAAWRSQLSLCGAPPQGVVCKAPLISDRRSRFILGPAQVLFGMCYLPRRRVVEELKKQLPRAPGALESLLMCAPAPWLSERLQWWSEPK
jgi:hypothetical protein